MKRLIIGDIHGSINFLLSILEDERPDQVIILGDYFDSFSIKLDEQVMCFNKICEIANKYNKLDNTDKFILLLGNHDYHYLEDVNEHYSGFNAALKNVIADKLKYMLKTGDMRFVYEDKVNKILFTHAGISQVWLDVNFDCRLQNYLNVQQEICFLGEHYKMRDLFTDDYVYEMTQKINEYYNRLINAHRFVGVSAIGDDVSAGPLWIRPHSLQKSAVIGYDQIFGHTHDTEMHEYYLSNNNKLYCLDCIDYNTQRYATYLCDTLDDDTKKLKMRKKCSIQMN